MTCWPRPHTYDPPPKELVLGGHGGCALFAGGELRCGENRVGSGVAFGAVAVGGKHTCAAETAKDVTLHCWGDNADLQLGPPSPDDHLLGSPGLRLAAGELRGIAAGARHTCVAVTKSVDADLDAVLCFGRGFGARRTLLAGSAVTALAAGADHTCALMGDTTVRCWGKNDKGQIGDGSTLDANEPASVIGVSGVVQIVAGARFTCGRLRSRTVTCWGDNSQHQLVNGTTDSSSKPVALHGLMGVEEIAAAGDGACARLADGDVRCWGRNDEGQLGDPSRQDHPVPMSVHLPR